MPEVAYGNLPFDEAIDFFRSKGFTISPGSWLDVWEDAHARAFTVARVTALDVLTDIRDEVQKALDEGISLGEFKRDLRKTLERKGWFAPTGERAEITMPDGTVRKRLTPWRLETIYRTNLQSAYSVGRYKQMKEVANERPYWQYQSMLLATTRHEHAAQHGKVYHHLHPFWNEWYPPNGFFCHCYVKTLSERQMKERDLVEQTRGVDEKPDDGWAYNVGEAGLAAWKPKLDLSQFPPEVQKIIQEEGLVEGGQNADDISR